MIRIMLVFALCVAVFVLLSGCSINDELCWISGGDGTVGAYIGDCG